MGEMPEMLRWSAWCDYRNVSRATGYTMRKNGRGPEITRIGTMMFVTRESDSAWMKKAKAGLLAAKN